MPIPPDHLKIASREEALGDGLGDCRALRQSGGDFSRVLEVAVDGFKARFVEGEVRPTERVVVGEGSLVGCAGG